MLKLIKSTKHFGSLPIYELWDKEGDQVLAYERGNLLFVFNFNGTKSFSDYGILVNSGSYKVVLNTDNLDFDGFGLINEDIIHFTHTEPKDASGKEWLKLYLPARSALVLKKR
jgi:1,4-alpha-glucan branching enzyme